MHAGYVIGAPGPIAVVSLRIGGGHRVRSHFERLCPEATVVAAEIKQQRVGAAVVAVAEAMKDDSNMELEEEKERKESEKGAANDDGNEISAELPLRMRKSGEAEQSQKPRRRIV